MCWIALRIKNREVSETLIQNYRHQSTRKDSVERKMFIVQTLNVFGSVSFSMTMSRNLHLHWTQRLIDTSNKLHTSIIECNFIRNILCSGQCKQSSASICPDGVNYDLHSLILIKESYPSVLCCGLWYRTTPDVRYMVDRLWILLQQRI